MPDKGPFFEADSEYKNLEAGPKRNEWLEDGVGSYAWINDGGSDAGFIGSSIKKAKIYFFYLLILFFALFIFAKSFYLQVIKWQFYSSKAENNKTRVVPIIAERGIIYDRNGRPLVKNAPGYYLTITPKDLPENSIERQKLMEKVSKIINLDPKDIEERLALYAAHKYQSIPIKNNLSYEEALGVEILNNTQPALEVASGIRRDYLAPHGFSQILGYLRKADIKDLEKNPDYLLTDDIGKSGLEAEYEKVLRGVYGKKRLEVDASGRQIIVLAKDDPIPGKDIILAIDNDLEEAAQKILERHFASRNLSRGTVIISNVKNGEILSIVNVPSYDNNIFSGELPADDYRKLVSNINKPLFNRSIAGEYPSGSTIKPIFAIAALEEGVIDANTAIASSGGIRVNNWFFPDWKQGGHGLTNVRKALAESVNTFFYIIGGGLLDKDAKKFIRQGLGAERLVAYAKKFGLGERLGIDIPGERAGFLPSKEWKETVKKEPWYIGDTYHLSIGQGDVLVTPLQVNFWTLAIANGGLLYEPHLVRAVVDRDGTQSEIQPKIKNSGFVNQKNIETIKFGLRDAVLWGSARGLNDLPFKVAGKTGTAEWGKGKRPHAWFTGFAPYDNPEIAITVLAEEAGEGSAIAVPIAKEILWYYFSK